jgi:hypothetical protein
VSPFRFALVVIALGCSAGPAVAPMTNQVPATATQLVHGNVRDYRKRLVAGAHVSATFERQSVGETRTDAHGAFTLNVPRGTSVSAAKDDMMGDAIVDGGELEIVMMQMPM